MKIGNKAIDFRVSILPVVWGEKTVFRILDSSTWLSTSTRSASRRVAGGLQVGVDRPVRDDPRHGPTGSGKSTTLYSGVAHIAEPEINLVTVEDPVEYTLEGINQVPVNPKRGLTFAGALRSILRQDPDVVLLGEIRDKETLEIAVKAALTGHLVLSTLHTNDAPVDDHSNGRHGHGPVHGRELDAADLRAAPRTQALPVTARSRRACPKKSALIEVGFTEEDLEARDFECLRSRSGARVHAGYKGRFALARDDAHDRGDQAHGRRAARTSQDVKKLRSKRGC